MASPPRLTTAHPAYSRTPNPPGRSGTRRINKIANHDGLPPAGTRMRLLARGWPTPDLRNPTGDSQRSRHSLAQRLWLVHARSTRRLRTHSGRYFRACPLAPIHTTASASGPIRVPRQHSSDRFGGLGKGGFLAHRDLSRSEDETEIPTRFQTGIATTLPRKQQRPADPLARRAGPALIFHADRSRRTDIEPPMRENG